jgi:hypothetical protein
MPNDLQGAATHIQQGVGLVLTCQRMQSALVGPTLLTPSIGTSSISASSATLKLTSHCNHSTLPTTLYVHPPSTNCSTSAPPSSVWCVPTASPQAGNGAPAAPHPCPRPGGMDAVRPTCQSCYPRPGGGMLKDMVIRNSHAEWKNQHLASVGLRAVPGTTDAAAAAHCRMALS